MAWTRAPEPGVACQTDPRRSRTAGRSRSTGCRARNSSVSSGKTLNRVLRRVTRDRGSGVPPSLIDARRSLKRGSRPGGATMRLHQLPKPSRVRGDRHRRIGRQVIGLDEIRGARVVNVQRQDHRRGLLDSRRPTRTPRRICTLPLRSLARGPRRCDVSSLSVPSPVLSALAAGCASSPPSRIPSPCGHRHQRARPGRA